MEFSPSTLFIFVGWLHSNVNGYIGQVIHYHVGNWISGEITIQDQNEMVLIENLSFSQPNVPVHSLDRTFRIEPGLWLLESI